MRITSIKAGCLISVLAISPAWAEVRVLGDASMDAAFFPFESESESSLGLGWGFDLRARREIDLTRLAQDRAYAESVLEARAADFRYVVFDRSSSKVLATFRAEDLGGDEVCYSPNVPVSGEEDSPLASLRCDASLSVDSSGRIAFLTVERKWTTQGIVALRVTPTPRGLTLAASSKNLQPVLERHARADLEGRFGGVEDFLAIRPYLVFSFRVVRAELSGDDMRVDFEFDAETPKYPSDWVIEGEPLGCRMRVARPSGRLVLIRQ